MKGRVLLVDDDPGMLKYCARLLAYEKYEVNSCACAAEASAAISSGQRYDLLLTDFFLGDGYGNELIALINRANPAAKTLIMTGAESLAGTRGPGPAYADAETLIKPFQVEDLLSALAGLLAAKAAPSPRRNIMPKELKTAGGLLLAALLACPQASQAGLWGRAKLQAAPAASAIAVDGRLSDWPASEPCEKDGLAFKAVSDGKDLYLSVSAHEGGAKAILSGGARQDVTFWFLDGKTRSFGVRLPFGRTETAGGQPPAPEFLTVSGASVSTSALPGNIEFDGEISSRAPAYELKIPLDSLKPDEGKVSADFETSYASEELKQELLQKLSSARREGPGGRRPAMEGQGSGRGSGRPQGGMGGGMMGGGAPPQGGMPPAGGSQGFSGPGGEAGSAPAAPELPGTITVKLSVILAGR